MNQNTLEVIVKDANDLVLINQSNVSQIEFCVALKQGGLSPRVAEVAKVCKESNKKVRVMLRNHAENFYVNKKQLAAIISFIKKTRQLPLDGYVFGALTKDYQVDYKALNAVIAHLNGQSLTFHKAFDFVKDKKKHLKKLLAYREIKFILTAGGTDRPLDNIDFFKNVNDRFKHQILIGGGVNLEVIKTFKKLGFKNFHIGKAARHNYDYDAKLSLRNINQYQGALYD